MKKKINEELLIETSELFKVFGDSSRLRILYLLLDKEKCVSEIASELNMSVSAISHQLRILKINKLIKNRREGKTIYYSLDDEHVATIIEQGIDHTKEHF